ncbi:DUF4214 domain-containing protein [Noviherbaspirillum sp. CPCC 100848]|uniref:DUF4214 domain-containing protein n=1 Tax=Noviherbaspirillum album TaxID=3080276 RepID=A0ABU6JIQ7_9BURK|nr:DUF4214 domain-containing protein [Noviherbaspirillum sp. CPCC 100848]MEC4723578.1 DUF4214 domain-containing protein [Noviherbaspirillum sp. CPCC 100848]
MTYSIKAKVVPSKEGKLGETAEYIYTITRTETTGPVGITWKVSTVSDSIGNNRSANQYDFVGGVLPSGTVIFNAGELEKDIRFLVAGDNIDEFYSQIFNIGIANTATYVEGIITDDDDVAEQATDASPELRVNSSVLTWVSTSERDTYKLNLVAGKNYSLNVSHVEGSATNFGAFDLKDAFGNPLITGGNDSATTHFTVPATGIYFVTLKSYYNHGGYQLVLTDSPASRISSGSTELLGTQDTLVLTGYAAANGTGNALNNSLSGNSAANALLGLGGNDIIAGYGGDDTIDGGAGIDTAVYSGALGNFAIEKLSNGYKITDKTLANGVDLLSDIERLKFGDKAIAFDISGNAGQAYRLYQAAFDRKPDLGGLGAQMNGLDNGMSLLQISQNFINSQEFALRYGANPSNEAFVTQLYANVLHRSPDAGGYAVQVKALHDGVSRAQLLVNFSESPENYNATIVGIQNGIEYTPFA